MKPGDTPCQRTDCKHSTKPDFVPRPVCMNLKATGAEGPCHYYEKES